MWQNLTSWAVNAAVSIPCLQMRIFLRWNRKFAADLRDWIVHQWSCRIALYAVLLVVFLLNDRGLCSAQLLNKTQLNNATRIIPTQPLSFLPSTSASKSCRMRLNSLSSRHLSSASVPALCDCLNRADESVARCILKDYHLGFCSKIPLHLTEMDFDNITDCHLRLEKIIQVDVEANRDFLQFQDIVKRRDCDPAGPPENRFSVRWKCADCLEAYTNWICARKVLPEVSKQQTPCAAICVRVLQRCPYYVPNVDYQYSGSPVFDCNDDVLDEYEDGENKSCFEFTEERKAPTNCTRFETYLATTSQPHSSLEITPATPLTVASVFAEQFSRTNISSLANRFSNRTSDRRETDEAHNSGS